MKKSFLPNFLYPVACYPYWHKKEAHKTMG